MKSLRELYTVGRGPSSSHTIGPTRACCLFREEHPDADRYEVALFGSLAMTGRGHLTDVAVRDALAPVHTDILWNTERTDLPHPNTMELRAYKNGALTGEMTALSVGGGAISIPGRPDTESPEVYPETSYAEISAFCSANRLRLSDYVFLREGEKIRDYLYDIWNTMKQSVSDCLTRTGELPGGLEVERKAQYLYNRRHIDESPQTRENRLVCAYAFAVAEQNASGGEIVTAPTCGASGVMPAALLYMQEERGFSDEDMVRALGVDTRMMKLLSLMVSNGLVGLSGALVCQSQKYGDVGSGTGAIVIGLAAIVIGEVLMGRLTSFYWKLTSVVVGSVIYFVIRAVVLRMGMDANDMKLLSDVIVALALCIPVALAKYRLRKDYSEGGEE